jgi:TetR/AcrR family transcriptional regulator, hemagglutinin/protease regulatory protein
MAPTERRAGLIKATLRTIAKQGIGETSHSAVAREAGVAVPTMFHYFATKEILIEATLSEVSRFLLEELLAANDNKDSSAPDSIECVLIAFCDSIDNEPDYARAWLEWSVSIRDTLWGSYLEFYKDAQNGIRRILKRGVREGSIRDDVNLDDASRVIVGLAHMVVQMKFSGASRAQVTRTVGSLVTGYLK